MRSALLTAVAALALTVPATAYANGLHENVDRRTGTVNPTATQQRAVAALGASATWNRFGTPLSLIRRGGFLATGIEGRTAADAARTFLEANKAVFGLRSTTGLRALHDGRLAASKGHAVLFGQRFGSLPTAAGGQVTVGITGTRATGWKVFYASSSLAGETRLAGAPRLSPQAAWLAAGADVGRGRSLVHMKTATKRGDWTVMGVGGLAQPQRARLVALPTPTDGVVPAYETIVLDGTTSAFKHYVDARTGRVLVREDLVHQAAAASTTPFTGTLPVADGACAPQHGPYAVPANTVSLDIQATANVPANDIVLRLYSGTTLVQAADTLTSPEVIHYEPAGGVPPGSYFVEVCEFEDGAPPAAPAGYTGLVTVNDAASTNPLPYPPRWQAFPASPLQGTLSSDPWSNPSTDTRAVWCWDTNVNGNAIPGCDSEVGNLAARVPWDHDLTTDLPTFTTRGNNARSGEAWTSPLTPGAFGFQPLSTQRNYGFPWANIWHTSDCSPTNALVPGVSNDISAAVTNLFAMHNRMHDWSYFLGFTEENWNAQEVNFGLTAKTRQGDSVIGNAQAGALSGGFPSYLGRDNANMIALPEGVRPITNMYLWQPLAGAFYAPCVDGDYDMAVIAHEYTHLIENRMIGKGGTRTGHHAGAMGESYSDLNAVEYLNEYRLTPVSGESPFAVGSYVTGNKQRAIRNYNMSWARTGALPSPGAAPQVNPLNFGDLGYDLTGGQVHADGEIWSAVNYDLRQALVAKYNGQYPASNAALQKRCADGLEPAERCPGNRRWIQIMYDAFLLMPVGPSMLDSRDAYLAADQARFGGANQAEIWLAFARRGLGVNATSSNAVSDQNDSDPKPDFERPGSNATVTFLAVASNEQNAAVNARVYVGHYEARVSPIAVTGAEPSGSPGSTNLDRRAGFAPGTYDFVAHAPGYGHVRFTRTFSAGQTTTVTINMPTNWASSSKSASASGDGENHGNLVDDTEGTQWDDPAGGGAVDATRPQVTVALGGGVHRVNRVQVSALLLGQNRFTALRQFRIEVSTDGVDFSPVLTSAVDAFPGAPPRPVAPELILRSFSFPAVDASHVRIVVLNNQCTGNSAFHGEQDNDPANDTDCRFGTPGSNPVQILGDLPDVLAERASEVHVAELQVFSSTGGASGGGHDKR
jgi:hypothetical protein